MLNLLKRKKGFTLAELMIVIAIIGILMVVLIPKVVQMKDSAKEVGIDANMRSVASQLEIMIGDYTDVSNLQSDLQKRLGDNVKNPLNGSTKVFISTKTESEVGAVNIITDSNDSKSTSIANDTDLKYATGSSTKPLWAGTVCVVIYKNADGTIEAAIYGYKKSKSKSTDGEPKTQQNQIIRVTQ